MLFNSLEYLLLFLPLSLAGYFVLNRWRLTEAATGWLIVASLVFYAWWKPSYLPLLLFSVLFNYLLGHIVGRASRYRRPALIFGIAVNLGLLGFFKYADFTLANIERLTDLPMPHLDLALPLAISFFTFQQIAYLVDSYRGLTREYDFLRYTLFVTFFPQLIAGPIVHHKEMIPQFQRRRGRLLHYHNISLGIFILTLGLFKKVIIADYFATVATPGFDGGQALDLFSAWATSLSYTFQLYFDFSGYSDMAIGAALMFNIRLPFNFDSPYKARDIQEFWRRWHITLSRFLRDYVYIPLGGGRGSLARVSRNLMITFLLGGLWHGAGWTFVFWGFLHGAAMVIHRVWRYLGGRLPDWLAWFVTFNFINASWVFFRANSWDDALRVLRGMVGLEGITLSDKLLRLAPFQALADMAPTLFGHTTLGRTPYVALLGAFLVTLRLRNSQQWMRDFRTTPASLVLVTLVFMAILMNLSKVSEFLYFNF